MLDTTDEAQYFGLGGPAHGLVVAAFVLLMVSGALVLNRMFWRLKTVPALTLDDVLIATALLLLFTLTVSTLAAVNAGYGRNSKEENMNKATIGNALMWFWVYQIIYKATLCATKTSILSLYLRVFSRFCWFHVVCRATFWLILTYGGLSIVVSIFQCSPVSRAWNLPSAVHQFGPNQHQVDGHCVNLRAFWIANATFNIVTDFGITVTIPFVVWTLELRRRQKFALTALLCLSLFAASTSVVRATSFQPPHHPHAGGGSGDDDTEVAIDPTSSSYRSTYWSTIEASLAIICACVPMLRQPLRRLFPITTSAHARSRLTSTTTDPEHASQPAVTTTTTTSSSSTPPTDPQPTPVPKPARIHKPPPAQLQPAPSPNADKPTSTPLHHNPGLPPPHDADVLVLIDAFPAVPRRVHHAPRSRSRDQDSLAPTHPRAQAYTWRRAS